MVSLRKCTYFWCGDNTFAVTNKLDFNKPTINDGGKPVAEVRIFITVIAPIL
jgi:hypothetical protein